ncbi:MAG TPA: MerR family transcriptional regulator [Blastocatellia bacterium]|nr:MerR family transcriptional regulator [Blastocatellia bacterium]
MLTATHSTTVIPDKLFFKIGEVCEIVGVQAHVLRYWESEFPTLQPQKNRAKQRTYRRKDVEMALRIKELLYDEGFTIAGAKKKLMSETRSASKLKVVPPGASAADLEPRPQPTPVAITESSNSPAITNATANNSTVRPLSRDTIERLKLMLEDLLTTLNHDVTKEPL